MEYHGLSLSDWEGLREMEEKVTVATADRLVKKQRETAPPRTSLMRDTLQHF